MKEKLERIGRIFLRRRIWLAAILVCVAIAGTVHWKMNTESMKSVVTVTIVDELFLFTGWEPKIKDVLLPEGHWKQIKLIFQADCQGDGKDRLYSVYLQLPEGNGAIELHRGITDFGGSIVSREDLTRYANLLQGTRRFGIIITTQKEGGWHVNVLLQFYRADDKPTNAASKVIPVFCLQSFPSGISKSQQVEFPAAKKVILTIFATGHGWQKGGEEYMRRNVVVKIDGRVIVNQRFDTWDPGQGRIMPEHFEITGKIVPGLGVVTVEIPNFEPEPGSYWFVSLQFSVWV